MRKYLVLTMILALGACNNGGGHSGDGVNYNMGNGTVISGGATTTKPGDMPSGDNATEKPGDDTPDTPQPPVEERPDSPNMPEYHAKNMDIIGPKDYYGAYYRGYINKETNEMRMEPVVSNGHNIPGISGGTGGKCTSTDGCVFLDNAVTILLKNTSDEEQNDANVILGSADMNVPLRFSEFGDWQWTVFSGGDTAREVDMHKLMQKERLSGEYTFTGKALAQVKNQKKHGTTNLVFNADTGQERLKMDFSGDGWYRVSADGDGGNLRFDGDVSDFVVCGHPVSASEMVVKYYGMEADKAAEEAVGIMRIDGVYFQGENVSQTVDFTFGAVKD